MISYTIREPIWSTRSIGIADERVGGDKLVEIRISYRDKEGVLMYPHRYLMRSTQIRTYPTKLAKGVKLYIVPMKDFTVTE